MLHVKRFNIVLKDSFFFWILNFLDFSIYRVGIIEWVDNTTPYQDLLMKAMTEKEKKAYNQRYL